ncbi:hypothetical protein DB88DRAFT_520590 [Papiliotrema laurentii]|uniref:Alpha-galactosidase n=1 Tax=Papiliotrema laurentii TaxID=5418 RepID=A0AAD9CUG1_PAPLA|nr:hypothetical protein DB88DRAFT_520590 [Papiliotrema laurentii]
MSISTQRHTLEAERDFQTIALDLRLPDDVWSWKTISFVRNKSSGSWGSHPDQSSSLLLLQSTDGRDVLAIYPVSTLAANCNLRIDTRASTLHMNIRRCVPRVETEVFAVTGRASSENARGLVKMVVEAARELVGGKIESKRSDFWDGLGVCTWESLGKEYLTPPAGRPTFDNLLNLIPPFPIETFLIDDGWQDSSATRALISFQPWSGIQAPMREVINSIKSKGVWAVGVWLTLQGYWMSIDPTSPLIGLYDCRPFPTARENQARGGIHCPLLAGEDKQWLPSPEKPRSSGSTTLPRYTADYAQITGPGSAHVQQAMWSGMMEAVERVWGGTDRVIMCMSHNERMLNGPGGISDDFNPDYPERHTNYIQWNVYQSILTAHLSFVLDFDMFASSPDDKWPEYHAFLRSLTPGPTLLSDAPHDETDWVLLDRLTSKVKSGATKVVKTDTPASALPGRWFRDDVQDMVDGPAIMAYVYVPEAHGSIIGAWNCHSDTTDAWARDHIRLQDIHDSLKRGQLDDEYVIWGMNLKGKTDGYALVQPGESPDFSIQLAKSECGGVVVSKVWQIGGRRVAVLGMLEKYAPLARLRVAIQADIRNA